MSLIQILFSTISDQQMAEKIARQLVQEHLAACVNIFPGATSIYSWKGEIQQEQECVLILKTCTDRLQELMARIKELHPYEVPEIVAVPIADGYGPYLEWVLAETC